MTAGARLPLAFITFGLAALGVAAGWLAVSPAFLELSHSHPQVVALAHLWLPGFLLSSAMGAMYQLMPVVLGSPLQGGERVSWVHLALHAGGLSLMIVGFARGRFDLVGTGGLAVTAGVLLFARIVVRTFLHSQRRDAVSWCFPLATGWLVMTVLAGLLLAANRHAPFLSLSPLALLRAHAHLGVLGFFLTLLQGATFQLIPMFTMGELRRPQAVATGLVLTQIALPLLFIGLAWDWPVLTGGGAATALAALALSGAALLATLRSRRRRELEPGLRGFVTGAALIGVGGIGAGILVLAPAQMMPGHAASAYGAVVIAGGLSLVMLGMLCKIIPFLVWMRTYGPRIGRHSVPTAASLASPLLERIWLSAHVSAVGLLTVSLLADSPALGRIAAWILAAGLIVYMTNAARVLSHTWKPRAGPLPARSTHAPA